MMIHIDFEQKRDFKNILIWAEMPCLHRNILAFVRFMRSDTYIFRYVDAPFTLMEMMNLYL